MWRCAARGRGVVGSRRGGMVEGAGREAGVGSAGQPGPVAGGLHRRQAQVCHVHGPHSRTVPEEAISQSAMPHRGEVSAWPGVT